MIEEDAIMVEEIHYESRSEGWTCQQCGHYNPYTAIECSHCGGLRR